MMAVTEAPGEETLERLQKVVVGHQKAICATVAEGPGERISLDLW
jgi:hypothetical protein